MSSGDEKGWEMLTALAAEDVCRRSRARFDKSSDTYTLQSFGMDISVSVRDQKIAGPQPQSDVLLQKLGYFSRLAMLWYLIGAKEIPLSGELVKPANLSGGEIFFRGSHVLPLDRTAERFSNDIHGFFSRGASLHGEQLRYGDASLRLFPFPRVPVVIILWRADEEFPARADLLFDQTCERHLPLDIIWSTAMLSLLML